MLIGGDGISKDVITLGWCFSWLLLFRARLPFALIGGSLAAQSTGNHRGVGGGDSVASSSSFSRSAAKAPGELARRLPEPLTL